MLLHQFPREGKYGHAAVWGLRPGCAMAADNAERQLPVAGMVANFTKVRRCSNKQHALSVERTRALNCNLSCGCADALASSSCPFFAHCHSAALP